MRRLKKRVGNCNNCLWNDKNCKIETNGNGCEHYYSINSKLEDIYVEKLIEKNRKLYYKEFIKYLEKGGYY